MQRQRVGAPTDVARHYRHSTEFTHRTRTAQQHAIQQRPADIRQRHPPECLPCTGAQAECGQFFISALLLHQRHQFAGDEREGHEQRGQHDAGDGEDDLGQLQDVFAQQWDAEMPAFVDQRPRPAFAPEDQDEHQSRHHRRDCEWQVDQTDQQALARKFMLAHRPRGGNAEHQVQRHHDGGDQQGQANRGQRVRFGDRGHEGRQAGAQGFHEHQQQRQQQEAQQEAQCRQDQQHLHPARLGDGGSSPGLAGTGRCQQVLGRHGDDGGNGVAHLSVPAATVWPATC